MKTMRVLLKLITVALLAALFALPCAMADSDFSIEDGRLVAYHGPGGWVDIPYGVTAIASSAFSHNTDVTYLELSSTVREIEPYAFSGCTELTHVSVQGVTTLGKGAFFGCTKLESIFLNEAITAIPDQLFYGCETLYNYSIPDGLTSIGVGAFYGCDNLNHFPMPGHVTQIGERAFGSCSGMSDIVLPESLQSLGAYAFDHCDALENVTFLNSSTTIDNNALPKRDNLTLHGYEGSTAQSFATLMGYPFSIIPADSQTSDFEIQFGELTGYTGNGGHVTIPDHVTAIGSYAFSGNHSLLSVTMPDTVTEISSSAFSGCINLKNIRLSDNLKHIGESVFRNCAQLQSIYIPGSVESIGSWTFEACHSLTSATLAEGITATSYNMFSGCTSLYDVSLPESLVIVEDWTFNDCRSLRTITFPESVNRIGFGALNNCSALESITFSGKDTQIDENAMPDNHHNPVVYGHYGSSAQTIAEQRNLSFIGCTCCEPVITCPHTHTEEKIRSAHKYEQIDDSLHSDCVTVLITSCCTECGFIVSLKESNDYILTDRHTFGSDGVCTACGAQNTCAHERLEKVDMDAAITESEDLGDGTHRVVWERTGYMRCAVCKIETADSTWTETEEIICEHDFPNRCTSCGFNVECAHENTTTFFKGVKDRRYEAVDSVYHAQYGKKVEREYCYDCGEEIRITTAENETLQYMSPHSWKNGVCGTCGYENACVHENTAYALNYVDRSEWIYVDAARHSRTRIYAQQEICTDCGAHTGVIGGIVESTQIQCHNFDEGICSCGYVNVCSHSKTMQTSEPREDWGAESVDENTHRLDCTEVTYTLCALCGETLSEEVSERAWREYPHRMYGDACYCGYTISCAHENKSYTDVAEIADAVYDCVSVSDKEHANTYSLYRYETCLDCGTVFDDRNGIQVGMTTVNEPHSFIGGVCSLCGADEKKPTREEILAEMGTTGNDSYRFGDTGAAVLKLQEMLADLDYYEGKVSGNFGNLTEEAVKLFQKDHGIAVDGICGPKTLRRIIDAYLGVEYTPTCEDYLAEMGADETTVYQLGDSGEGVLKLQEMLKTLGYYYGETTGNFGELTRNAVQNFQANYGFAYTGICDYNTLVKIICVLYRVEPPACKHTTTREVIERRDARYEPADEKTHNHIYNAVIVTRCILCNNILDETDAGTFALPYNHNFSEGVCLSCGMEDPSPEEEEPENPCPHESVTPHLYKGADESIYEDLGDGLHHKVTRTGRMVNYCDDCGACVGDMFIGTVESVDEHTHKNACSLCTYRADCAHEAPRTELTYTEPELRPVDNAHHASCAHQITTVFCADCGDILSEETADEEQVLYIGAHSGDTCYCGWENACDHPSTSVKLVNTNLSDVTPRCRDEYTHVRNMIYEEINACTVCGMQVGGVISLKQKELIEPHYTYLDHCECGWKNPCAHTGATHEQEARRNWFGSYYVDENTHMEDAYYVVETICDDCGLTIAITEDVRKQKLLPHTFEEGECTGCHYITCSHEHVQIRTAADKTRVLYAEPISANAHRLFCEKVKFAECMDCGTSFSGAAVGTAAVLQSHEVVGGSCIVCGQCAHLIEMRQQKVTGWDHSTLYYNAYMHESTQTKHMVETCGACGEVMREWNEQDNTHYSRHYYSEDGVCSGCDYQNPCTHAHAYRAVTNGYSSSYEDLDDTHHTEYRSRSTHMYCPDCLYTWDYQNEEPVEVVEKHRYGREITECMDCGHINTCLHENTEERYSIEYRDVYQYIDENRHYEFAKKYAFDYCFDCGATRMNRHVEEEKAQCSIVRHYDNGDGVCPCGYAFTCAHTNTMDGYRYSGSYAMPLDEQIHAHTTYYTLYSVCVDCGEQLRSQNKVVESTRYEQHAFNDRGFCQSCYYQLSCTHSRVRSETVTEWYGGSPIDETLHEVIFETAKRSICMDCGISVELEIIGLKSYIEPHESDAWGCYKCNYSHLCLHPNTEIREEYWDTYSAEPIDETSHTILMDIHFYEYCTDCGQQNAEVSSSLQTRTLPHNFGETDRCRDCGYVNTCEHDQKERFRTEGYAFSYTALDAQLHALNQDFQTELRCTDCGKVFSHGMERNVGSTAPHTLNANGRCIYCGYTDDLFGEVRTLTLPAMLREVHAEAFAGGAYTEVICPAGLEEIGARAFADCSALRRVVIPGDAIYIESDAFEGTSPVIYGMPESDAQAFAYEQDFIFLPLE